MAPQFKLLIKQRQKAYHQRKDKEWKRLSIRLASTYDKERTTTPSQFKNKDSKKLWSTVNNLNGKAKKQEEMKLTVEQLNNGFHQVWQNIEKSDTTEFLIIQGHNFQEAIQVSAYTVIMARGKFDASKAPEPDNINNTG